MGSAQQQNHSRRAAVDGKVPAGPTAPAKVLAAVNALAASIALSGRDLERLQLVIEELVTNIVTHGTPPAGSPIFYRFERLPEAVRIEIADHGAPFDPRSDLRAGQGDGTPAKAEGGVGWPLILRWCQITDYEREAEMNRVVLVLPLTSSTPE